MTSPIEQWRYEHLVFVLSERSRTRGDYRRYCRLVALLTAALPRERVAQAYAEFRKAA